MKHLFIHSLLTIFCLLTFTLSGFGQKSNSGDSADSLFTMSQIHTVHLTVTAENWEKMQPPQRVGFGGGFGPPPGMRPGQPTTDGGDVFIGPPGGFGPPQGGPPGRFGFEFEYVHGAIEINGQNFKDAAVRFKGNASYMTSQRGLKRPFKIDLNKFEKNAQYKGQTTIVLNNNIMDPTMMREAIAYPLFRAAGLPASRTGYAKVYLTVPGKHDREYLGLYTLVEYVDEEFLRRHFGNGNGLLLKPEGMMGGVQYLGEEWAKYKDRYDAKSGDKGEEGKKAQKHLIQFANLVNNGSDADFQQKIEEYLDVGAFVRFLAVNSLTSNLDSILAMGHNYYIYLNPNTNKFVFFPWDLDLSFAGFPMAGSSDQQIELSLDQPYSGTNKLIERLLAMEAVKKSYHDQLQLLIKTSFNSAELEKPIAVAETLIRESLKSEPQQPAGPMGRGGPFSGRAIPIREFVPRRIESVNAQLSGKTKGYVPQNRMRFGGGPVGPGGNVVMTRPGTMEAQQLLKALDADQGKSLSQSEAKAGAKLFFANADKDKNNKLNADEITGELENLLSNAGIMAPGFILSRAILRVSDKGRDGGVSPVEWADAVTKHFGDWDTNKNNSLDEPELLDGLSKLMSQSFPRFVDVTPSSEGNNPAKKN